MTDDLKARRAAAEAKIEERKRAHKLELEQREVVLLECRAKYEEELGPMGEAFALIDGGAEGPIVLKLGAAILHKDFHATVSDPKGKGVTVAACERFTRPCVVYPDATAYLEIIGRRPGLAYICANALEDLYGRNEAEERSK